MSATRQALSLVGIVLATSLLRWLLPPGFLPFDLFLVATVFVALRSSVMTAQVYGLAAGLLQDIFSSPVIGTAAFAKTVVGFSVAVIRKSLLIKGWIATALTFVFATATDEATVFGIRYLFNLPDHTDWMELSMRCLSNTVAGLVIVKAFGIKTARAEKEAGYEIP